MHVLVVMDRQTTATAKSASVLAALKQCLHGYSWVKPMSIDLYIVKVASEAAREQLRRELVAICEENPGTFHVLISPALPDGSWSGWLPKAVWEKVKKRTNPHRA